MAQLAKCQLLILDDWGIQKVTAPQRIGLMEIVEDRRGPRFTLVANQRLVDLCHNYIIDIRPIEPYANCFIKRNRPSRTLDIDASPGPPISTLKLRELPFDKQED
uniref:IstB-like ATP binding protein n=1 Tax=Candidatus Kentrum sp. SD TaxID=2126332 RepID=A0A450YAI3_9GAMM|nr:MAG: IstB-like ATP binding protein [Candidatus Kentron sp. SD]VFK38551.1 MAG: IstB-like ATP binding protein [Candidatus Kentron sp. SD]